MEEQLTEEQVLDAISLLMRYLIDNEAESIESPAIEAGLYELRDLL
jgi:hypothetical protein